MPGHARLAGRRRSGLAFGDRGGLAAGRDVCLAAGLDGAGVVDRESYTGFSRDDGKAPVTPQTTHIELLQRMPFFGAIRPDAVRLLLDQARGVSVEAGDYFFHENEQGDSMFVLESGRASVIKAFKGQDYLLHELGAGDCFGEMSLMDLGPRSASVRASQDCTAIELGASDLLRLYERDAEQFALVQMNIGREVCRRLRATDELLFRASIGELTPADQTTQHSV